MLEHASIKRNIFYPASLFIGIFLLLTSCCKSNLQVSDTNRQAVIYPDYNGVTVPINIAPLNFIVAETGDRFIIHLKTAGEEIKITSPDSIVVIPPRIWEKLLSDKHISKIELAIYVVNGTSLERYEPIYIQVVQDEIDPYVCYRVVYPGYESWGEMQIIQRSLENFRQHTLADNKILDGNCINCHTFLQSDTEKYFIHVRGNKAGTYFINNNEVTRRELRTDSMPGNAVYPSWHPSGRYIAFSSNQIHSVINMKAEENIELYDRASILVLYDQVNNSISPCKSDSGQYILTHPCWSPDGNYLYFCRTEKVRPGFDYRAIRYNLYRMPFDSGSGKFGVTEQIFNAKAINKSVSFPVISPDGRSLIFIMHDYGTFPGWHNEADLYSLNLITLKEEKLNINSPESESFAAWSSEGKWLVFSSKRDDGLNSRLYFAYFNEDGSTGKPFMLPEKDPSAAGRLNKSYNRPQMVKAMIQTGPRDFEKASRNESKKVKWIE